MLELNHGIRVVLREKMLGPTLFHQYGVGSTELPEAYEEQPRMPWLRDLFDYFGWAGCV